MKISSFLLIMLLIISFQAKSQNEDIIISDVVNSSTRTQKDNWSITKNKLYCKQNLHADSTLLMQDTIIFTKSRITPETPYLRLTMKSSFQFYYNIKDTVIIKRNEEKGEMSSVLVRKQDEIYGSWKSSDLLKTISLRLKNNQTYKYTIHEKEEYIWFIKD